MDRMVATAGHNKYFDDVSMETIRNMMGVKLTPGSFNLTDEPLHLPIGYSIPDQFDAREEWPNCPTIKEIRDQSHCGSCWAIAAVEAMSDRICIASKGNSTPHLSTNDLMSCCFTCGDGCGGATTILPSWQYWVDTGIVTGGTNATPDGCRPYPFPPCNHLKNEYKPCSHFPDYTTPACDKQCQNVYPVPFEKDKFFGSKAYSIPKDEILIQTDIMEHGPVEAVFLVYEDFFHYKSGVYKHVAGGNVLAHAVKLIGWGVEKGEKYWLAANSWNEEWGDKGFFKILRGKDECGIEDMIAAGWPKINGI